MVYEIAHQLAKQAQAESAACTFKELFSATTEQACKIANGSVIYLN